MIPRGFRAIFIPRTKSLSAGTWARTLFPRSRSACFPCSRRDVAVSGLKNWTSVGIPFSSAALATLAAGSMPKHRNVLCLEELEQVAVVARNLDHLARLVEAESSHHVFDVRFGVCNPTVRERGEVRIIGEDVLGRLELLQLDQKAIRAHVCVQGIEGLHPIELVSAEIGVRQWRHPQIAEGYC